MFVYCADVHRYMCIFACWHNLLCKGKSINVIKQVLRYKKTEMEVIMLKQYYNLFSLYLFAQCFYYCLYLLLHIIICVVANDVIR